MTFLFQFHEKELLVLMRIYCHLTLFAFDREIVKFSQSILPPFGLLIVWFNFLEKVTQRYEQLDSVMNINALDSLDLMLGMILFVF